MSSKNIPAPIPDEYSIHSPVTTSSVVPNKFNELLILHSLRRARKAADSYRGSPVNRDNAPISSIREPESRRKTSRSQDSISEDVLILILKKISLSPHPEVLVSVVSFSITPYCP